jgi:peptidoglycan/LPS O-acetylase OafA/YrhL
MEEFSLVILLLALIPFAILFYMKMDSVHKKRILWVTIAYSGLFLLGLLTFWSNQVKGANIDVAPIRGYELFLKLRVPLSALRWGGNFYFWWQLLLFSLRIFQEKLKEAG